LVGEQCRGALAGRVVGQGVGGFRVGVKGPASALNVTAGRCQEGGRGLRVGRNLLQVPLLDQTDDLLFSLASPGHGTSSFLY
jgi:hypothetical protein